MKILHSSGALATWLRGGLLASLTASLATQSPSAPFDHDIEIGVQPGHLRFAKEAFLVKPGSRVRLTLTNTDAMQHNLLICRPGKDVLQRVAVAAAALGAEASKREFVPASPDVLHATKAILPGQKDVIEFTAPKVPGDYPYVCTLPGHFFTMRGVMTVGDKLRVVPIQRLRYTLYQGKWKKLPKFADLDPKKYGRFADGVIDLAAIGPSRNYGVVFEGTLRVEKDADYRFKMRSDDGARLTVGTKVLLDLDGVHPMGSGESASLRLAAGEHPLRLDYFQGGGGAGLELSYRVADRDPVMLTKRRGGGRRTRALPLPVLDRPVVVRAHVEGAGARSIAVGLPGGTNFIFDAARCMVERAWVGGFLDVGPDRLGRGGKPCKILGQQFAIGGGGAVLKQGGKALPVRFRGYQLRKDGPAFEFDWGRHRVVWAVRPAASGIGLEYQIDIPTLPAADSVELALDRAGVRVVCADGELVADRGLRVTGKRGIQVRILPTQLNGKGSK